MTSTITRDDLTARLDAIDDNDLLELLDDLEDGTDATIPNRAEKIAVTGEAIRRRPFAAFLCLAEGEPVTGRAAAWAVARYALFGPKGDAL